MEPAAPLPWASLQTDALQIVFEALPDAGSRAACRLVCRRWREVADESPSIWSACGLRRRRAAPAAPLPPPLLAAVALLSRQRRVLRRLQLDLGALRPEGAMPAAEVLAAAVSAACGPDSGLTDITLGLSGQLPLCVAQALPGSASQLTALTIRPLPGQPPPSVRWAGLTHLRPLSSLALTAADFGQQAGPTAGLAQLGLTRLRLHGAQGYAAGRPAGLPEVGPVLLACPPALQRLELAAVRVLCCEVGARAPAHAESSSSEEDTSEENGSEEDGSSSSDDNDPDDAVPAAAVAAGAEGVPEAAGHGLGQLAAADGGQNALAEQLAEPAPELAGHAVGMPAAPEPAGAPAPVAAAGAPGPAFGAAQQGPWQHHGGGHLWMRGEGQRLAAGLRERWQRLEVLRLHNVDVSREVLKVLPSLPCLTSLHLAPRFGSSEAILEAQRCSALQELTLARCEYRLPPLPPGALPQLTRLRISGSEELMKLHPSWCMLPALQSFELESCEQLMDLPLELSALDRLERLSFSHQRMERLPWMLTGLSQLTRLAVAACSLESLPAGPYLRSLRELVLFANNLSCVPPALAHPDWGPKGLRRLDLSSNYGHQLSAADVAVLGTLASLEALNLQRQVYAPEDAHPQHRLEQLRAALPDCDILV